MSNKGLRRYISSAGLLLCLAAGTVTAGSSTPALQWTWDDPSAPADGFNTLSYGNGMFVAAGDDGVIYMSSDGVTWTSETGRLSDGGRYVGSVYGKGMFVLGGVLQGSTNTTGYLASSSDGVHWSSHTFITGNNIDDGLNLAYCNGKFYANGENAFAISSDGVHWKFSNIHSVGSGPMYCANGILILDNYYTTNGVDWNYPTSTAGKPLGVSSSNGSEFFLWAVDGSKSVWTSTDADHWTKQTMTGNAPDFELDIDLPFVGTTVTWDGTQFVALYTDDLQNETVYTSADGIAWTKKGTPTAGSPGFNPQQIVYTGGTYYSIGTGYLAISESTDALTWTTAFSGATTPLSEAGIDRMIFAGGQYIAIGYDGFLHPGSITVLQSADGLSWNDVYVYSGTASSGSSSTVTYGGGVYVGASGDQWASSSDGVTWSPIPSPPGTLISDLASGNGSFAGFTGSCTADANDPGITCSGVKAASSTDGVTWSSHRLPAALIADGAYMNIGFTGSQFIAIGTNQTASVATVYTSPDGMHWTTDSTFSAPAGTSFTRISTLDKGFAAIGAYIDECPNPDPQEGCINPPDLVTVVATSADGVTWTANTVIETDGGFNDITHYGKQYFLFGEGYLYVSPDGVQWCYSSNVPSNFDPNSAVVNGNQLVLGSARGYIISTTSAATGGEEPCTNAITAPGSNSGSGSGGGSSTPPIPPPSHASGGGGDFDLMTLGGLLGFALRRRGGARHRA